VRTAAPPLALFCIPAGAIHLVLQSDAARVGHTARAVLLGLRPLSPRPLEPAQRRAVHDPDHLGWLVQHLLTLPRQQPGQHPALWSGSALLDLLGARWLDPPLASLELPGFEPAAILAELGLGADPLVPLDNRSVLLAGPGRLLRASGAALAADPALEGKATPIVAARQAAAVLGRKAGLPTRTIADALGLTTQGVRRLQLAPAPRGAISAVRRYMALEDRVIHAALAAS